MALRGPCLLLTCRRGYGGGTPRRCGRRDGGSTTSYSRNGRNRHLSKPGPGLALDGYFDHTVWQRRLTSRFLPGPAGRREKSMPVSGGQRCWALHASCLKPWTCQHRRHGRRTRQCRTVRLAQTNTQGDLRGNFWSSGSNGRLPGWGHAGRQDRFIVTPMKIEAQAVVDALNAYRRKLLDQGFTAKAAAVAHCVSIVKRLSS